MAAIHDSEPPVGDVAIEGALEAAAHLQEVRHDQPIQAASREALLSFLLSLYQYHNNHSKSQQKHWQEPIAVPSVDMSGEQRFIYPVFCRYRGHFEEPNHQQLLFAVQTM